MICAQCGSEIPQGQTTCYYCGWQVPADANRAQGSMGMSAPTPTPPPSSKPAKEKKNVKKLVIILSAVVLAAVLALLTIFVILPMIKYNQGVQALRDGQYEKGYALLEQLGDYKDAPEQIEKAKMEQSLALLNDGKHEEAFKLISKIEMTTDFRAKLYKAGIKALDEEYYECAYHVFEYLDDYKLSENYYLQAFAQYYNKVLENCDVGDVITFGAIDQDNDTDNGKEEINWIVLQKKTGAIKLISESVLLQQQYNSSAENVTWATSLLRTKLNTEFLKTAFDTQYQQFLSSSVDTDNVSYDIVTVLTAQEAKAYFAEDSVRVAELTKTAKKEKGTGGWWLKDVKNTACYVDDKGVLQSGAAVTDVKGVRPVINLLPAIPVVYAEPEEVEVPEVNVPTEETTDIPVEQPTVETPTVQQPVEHTPVVEETPDDEPTYFYGSTSVGDIITMGAYEQDNNTSNGKENIEWEVIAIRDGKALVISRYAIECLPYHDADVSVTWETCSLRKWLNNDFYYSAFGEAERGRIQSTVLTNEDNSEYATDGGNDTTDNVFLLSISEVQKYIPLATDRVCKATDHAAAGGVWVDGDNGDNCWWWLRSPGTTSAHAAGVRTIGAIGSHGNGVTFDDDGVRPAMWISID